ncbi:hypothetical protein DL95DRAFT_497615 [Leptodontidium sp. 2 PMI_412]|nr:hypothetical protein DL95DRAFT_497615 [Leptodontidium sp. 2 PMI_412]
MCLAEGCPSPTPQTPPSVPSGVKRARRYEGTKRQALSSVVPPCFRYFLSSKSSENDVREGDDACPTCCNLDLTVLLQRKIFGPENAGPVHMPVDPAVLELSSKTCEPCSVIWEGISVHLARLDYRMPEIPNSVSLIIDQWGGLTAEVRYADYGRICDVEFYIELLKSTSLKYLGLRHLGTKVAHKPRKQLTTDEAGANWFEIVSNYSDLKLTKASDIIPAFGRLAVHFSKFMAASTDFRPASVCAVCCLEPPPQRYIIRPRRKTLFCLAHPSSSESAWRSRLLVSTPWSLNNVQVVPRDRRAVQQI